MATRKIKNNEIKPKKSAIALYWEKIIFKKYIKKLQGNRKVLKMEGTNNKTLMLKKKLILAKVIFFFIFTLCLIFISKTNIYAQSGEMFYFGGVTEGSKLPKTIESYVANKSSKGQTYTYKEAVCL